MEPQDWLILAISDGQLEPIQVQKLMFVFAQKEKDSIPKDEAYDFVPYDWGPCSFEIYDDLELLIEEEVVGRLITKKRKWHTYQLTEKGKTRLKQLRKKADKYLLKRLEHWREWVTTKSFRQLLLAVYQEYPEYATASRLGN